MRVCHLLGLLAILFVVSPVVAQETTEPQRTAVPADVRYEVVQSTITAKFTVRLDKYIGTTHVMVKKANGDMTWQLLPRVGHATADSKVPGRVNYQIFTSGLTIRDTFLINVNTGATWQLYHDSKENEDYWGAIE
jgi:hypothetical protein